MSDKAIIISVACVVAFAVLYNMSLVLLKTRNPTVLKFRSMVKAILLPISLHRYPLRDEISSDFPKRVFDIEWGDLNSAYGPAFEIPFYLVTLAQNRNFDYASGELRSHLCHQDSSVDPATWAALPFYLELSQCNDDELVADILFKLDSLAFCTNPNHPANRTRIPLQDFETSIYNKLIENMPHFQELSKSDNSDIAYAASCVIEELTKTENAA